MNRPVEVEDDDVVVLHDAVQTVLVLSVGDDGTLVVPQFRRRDAVRLSTLDDAGGRRVDQCLVPVLGCLGVDRGFSSCGAGR